MLEIQIIALGKLKENYLKDAIAEYQKRLTTMCSFKIIELEPFKLSQNPSEIEISKALSKEAEEILKKTGTSKIVAMCIEGKMLSSNDLCDFLESLKNFGDSKISFVIGSSFGLSDEIKTKAALKLSMSKMTFPHQLARVMLSEQIYRALSIGEGLKYHK